MALSVHSCNVFSVKPIINFYSRSAKTSASFSGLKEATAGLSYSRGLQDSHFLVLALTRHST